MVYSRVNFTCDTYLPLEEEVAAWRESLIIFLKKNMTTEVYSKDKQKVLAFIYLFYRLSFEAGEIFFQLQKKNIP